MLKKKEKRMFCASALMGLVITICAAFYTESYSDYIQSGIAKEVIRFHILANSDLIYDQELKLKVRDGILDELKEELSEATSVGKTRRIILDNIYRIEEVASEIINESGFDYPVTASLEKGFFPTIRYADVVFPAGKYEALKIEIGASSGKNWWCVVFPPLCYVDITQKEIPVESKEDLKNILTDEEYSLLLSNTSATLTPKIKFKIVEVWQKIHKTLGAF